MRHLRRSLMISSVALVSCIAAVVAAASPVQAADGRPCGAPWWHTGVAQTVQTCPDWAPDNRIPVYNVPWNTGGQIGYIDARGDDWYVCQVRGDTRAMIYNGQNLQNDWWAYTLSDDGHWGYVNEIYFQGGVNYERDAGLRIC